MVYLPNKEWFGFSFRALDGYQTGVPKNLEVHAAMEGDVQAEHGARCGPLVQLLGGSDRDPFGDNGFVKKLKHGEFDWSWLGNWGYWLLTLHGCCSGPLYLNCVGLFWGYICLLGLNLLPPPLLSLLKTWTEPCFMLLHFNGNGVGRFCLSV